MHTYLHDSLSLAIGLFKFGWLNVGPVDSAAALSLLALLIVLWHGDRNAELLTGTWRIRSLTVCLCVIVLLSLALYLAWTPLAANMISGLQGRYYLPLALPAVLCLLRRRTGKASFVAGAVPVLLFAANVAVLITIGRAYYS